MYSIETKSLTKSFGDLVAVNDISFSVEKGEIFGFLGPNGAGKSTTMMIFTTLLKPTNGNALVGGFDVLKNPKQVRENIGFVQQETTVDEYLSGRENLLLQAKLNHIPKNEINQRIDEVLDLIELSDKQDEAVVTYSGGMRKRLDIAGGLLHHPRVLFLDEPTVGLDIQTRRKIWQYIKKIHTQFDMTIFLTTHYMEEAEELCDRITIINNGKVIKDDTKINLLKIISNKTVLFQINSEIFLPNELNKYSPKVENGNLKVTYDKNTTSLKEIIDLLNKNKISFQEINTYESDLEDIFLKLVKGF